MEWVVVIEAVSLEDNGNTRVLFSDLLSQLSEFDAAGFTNHNGHLIKIFVNAKTGFDAIAKALIVTSRAQTSLKMPEPVIVAISAVDVELLAAQTERTRVSLTDSLKQSHSEGWRRSSLRWCRRGTRLDPSP